MPLGRIQLADHREQGAADGSCGRSTCREESQSKQNAVLAVPHAICYLVPRPCSTVQGGEHWFVDHGHSNTKPIFPSDKSSLVIRKSWYRPEHNRHAVRVGSRSAHVVGEHGNVDVSRVAGARRLWAIYADYAAKLRAQVPTAGMGGFSRGSRNALHPESRQRRDLSATLPTVPGISAHKF